MIRAARATAAAVTLVFVAAACGGGRHADRRVGADSTTAVGPRHTTTSRPPVRAPLTGLVDPSGATASRPALTVKVDNHPSAHPQVGLDAADVVYEEIVECGITRLAAVFQSHVPAVVGPVRSVRRTDQALVRRLRGIFVYSGGAAYAEESIATAPVVRFNETTAGTAMYRDRSRSVPHNLFVHPPAIYGEARGATGPPKWLFAYRAAGAPVTGGTPTGAATIGFQGGHPSYAVTWEWDPASRRWLRSIFGRPDVLADGTRVSAANVVVQTVTYGDAFGGATYCGDVGAQAGLVGTGDVVVLTAGVAVHGRWARTSADGPTTFTTSTGVPIALTPGNTWVELPKPTIAVTTTP